MVVDRTPIVKRLSCHAQSMVPVTTWLTTITAAGVAWWHPLYTNGNVYGCVFDC